MIDPNDPSLAYRDEKEAGTPPEVGIVTVFVNGWWLKHPERGLLYYRGAHGLMQPQGNTEQAVTQRLRERLYPWAHVVRVPFVYSRGEYT